MRGATRVVLPWVCVAGVLVSCGLTLADGKSTYEENCQQCHGVTGMGDGPFAENLFGPPSDLTVLARNNGGAFPAQYVTDVVDGHARSDAFSAAMPEFAQTLGGEELRLGPLVDYVESLQR